MSGVLFYCLLFFAAHKHAHTIQTTNIETKRREEENGDTSAYGSEDVSMDHNKIINNKENESIHIELIFVKKILKFFFLCVFVLHVDFWFFGIF